MLNQTISTQIYTKICFRPTLSQEKCIEKLSFFLSDSDFNSIFILNGYAGTGKTTIIAALVGALNSLKMKCVLLAPTGRAAKVVARYSSQGATTIHKHIYRERTNAAYESKFMLSPNRDSDVVYIIDEASMLSDGSSDKLFGSGSLLEDLITYIRSGKRCRVIFVGDSAQLPPVGSDFSPALDEIYMSRFGDVTYTLLDEVVRQQIESGILFNATMVRCMLENNLIDIPHFEMNYPDFKSIEGGELTEVLQDCYDKYGMDETIVITRSNKRANRYNEGVRRFCRAAEEQIESGDNLMIVRNNYHYTERIKDCPMSFIANGDTATLKRIRRFEEFYGFNFAEAVLSFGDYNDTEIECRILLDTLSSESPSLTYEQSQRLFYEIEKDFLDIKSRMKRLELIRATPHYNALQIKFAYAVTCHKAQGGEWRAVFVDRCLFGEEVMSADMMRWLYTALTRARDVVYLVNFDERFLL